MKMSEKKWDQQLGQAAAMGQMGSKIKVNLPNFARVTSMMVQIQARS